MKKKYFLVFFFLFSLPVFAQEWVEMMSSGNADFYQIQKSFYQYYEGKTHQKGDGWKPFKRWEYFMEARTFPTGKLPNPEQVWREMKKYNAGQKSKKSVVTANWQPLGPYTVIPQSYNPGNGRVNVVAQHPANGDIVYVGVPSGGLWKTEDAGWSWTPLTDDFPVLGVSGIAINRLNPEIIYIATGDGDGSNTYSIGVLKSYDGGLTWDTTGLNWSTTLSWTTSKLIMHPADTNILFAATSTGIYKTTDAGKTWQNVNSGSFRDIEFNSQNPSVMYASNSRFFKSTDGGNSFTPVTSGLPSSGVSRLVIGVTPANANYIYLLAGASDNTFYGFYQSTDGGDSFTLQSSSPNILGYDENGNDNSGQAWYDLAIAVSPTDENEVYTGGVNVWKTYNGGQDWSISSHWYLSGGGYPYVHADIHTLDFFGNKLYAGCDGGIFMTEDGGSYWYDLNSGLQIMQFYRIGSSASNSKIVYGGAQDNGTNQYNNGDWSHVLGADGMECFVDYSNPYVVYATIQNGGLNKSINGGVSFSGIKDGIDEGGGWVTPFIIHPTDPNTIFAGFKNVWKSDDGGYNWYSISNFTSGTLDALAISSSNPDVIYTSNNSTIYKTINGGQNWQNISSGLPGNAITYITIHPLNPDSVWVTLSGYSAQEKVYYSSDGGTSWNNFSGTLPNIPANCIVYANTLDDATYVGMDVGVYYRDNTMSDWQPFMDGLPNVIVDELEVHPSGKLRAGTYGRGLWETDILVGVNENNSTALLNVLVHPNPFTHSITIAISNLQLPTSNLQLLIYDVLGQVVHHQTLNSKLETLNLDLPSGIYFYQVTNDKKSIARGKIVKQ